MSSTAGMMARNTQRQPTVSLATPANAGPTRPGTTHALDTSAIIRGAADGG